MPVVKCSNGKYRIGKGPCMYHSKEKAKNAYGAYRAKMNESENPVDSIKIDVPLLIRLFELAREDLNNDIIIHVITEYLIDQSKTGETLTMDCYDSIVKLVNKDNEPENDADNSHDDDDSKKEDENKEPEEGFLKEMLKLAGLKIYKP